MSRDILISLALLLALVSAQGEPKRRIVGENGKHLSQDNLRGPMFQTILKQLVKHYNMQSNSAQQYVLYNVESVTSQVVAGLKLNFSLSFVPSNCMKQSDLSHKTLNDCGIGSGHADTCTMGVFAQPWKETIGLNAAYKVTSIRCEASNLLHLHSNLFHTGADDSEAIFEEEYEEFKRLYGNSNSNSDDRLRYKVFKDNMKKAKLLQMLELGTAEYGITPFSDLSPEEFLKQKLTPKWDLSKAPHKHAVHVNTNDVPTAFDWRDHGAVTPVKDQGQCGSCWAFSTTGNVEGQWFIKKGALVQLSEQELLDCDKVDEGCDGGLPSKAYKEIERIGGLESEDDYPYKGVGEKCSYHQNEARVYVNDSVSISKDETEMAAWLVKNGPISIGINGFVMQFYRGGVSHPLSLFCSKTDIDHGVLIVGFGVEEKKKNEPYWIVKNSWGPTWGEKGYYRVYRGDGTCGLNQLSTSAIVY